MNERLLHFFFGHYWQYSDDSNHRHCILCDKKQERLGAGDPSMGIHESWFDVS